MSVSRMRKTTDAFGSKVVPVKEQMVPDSESAISGAAVSSFYFSNASQTSGAEVQEQLNKSGTTKQKAKDILKLVGVVLPLLLAVGGIASISLSQAMQSMAETNNLQEQIGKADLIKEAVLDLQKERGMSCVYLSSDSNFDIVRNMERFRSHVDAELGKLIEGNFVAEVWTIKRELQLHRQAVWNRHVDCAANLIWYTAQIDKLLAFIQNVLRDASEQGVLWNTVAAYTAALKAVDLIGIKRAMGSSFFTSGFFDEAAFADFIEITGGAKYLLQLSWNNFPKGGEMFSQIKQKNPALFTNINALQTMITRNLSGAANNAKGIEFFDYMTEYIVEVMKVEKSVSTSLFFLLEQINQKSLTRYHLAISIIAISLLLCPAALIWYAYQAQKMKQKIRKFTEKLANKTTALNTEKKKMDMLLMQLLPVSIVQTLKQGHKVEPETFDQVTIYFSDIIGFTSLSSCCSAIQVVDLLNELYTKCDTILDQYDVYKVETIGDAYMVASGLPKRNGNKHSNEVATMALDILQMMETFCIPHINDEALLMRIGIHTGPCAAGIVGSKMPRYCLFGDSVNTASRMESTGLGMRIQLSKDTQKQLTNNHKGLFEIKGRGNFEVKGKGSMNTYWLLGKEGFPYRISLEAAESKVARTAYWKKKDEQNKPEPEVSNFDENSQ